MKKKLIILIYLFFFLSILGVGSLFFVTSIDWLGPLPSIEDLENPKNDLASEVIASNGSLIGKFYLKDRIPVSYDNLSKNLIHALIATEDKRFFEHSGIDFFSLFRVAFGIVTFRPKGGGSTISQQLAHNLLSEIYPDFRRSKKPITRIHQKIKEWIVAIRLEKNFTKEEILVFYFNTVPFGQNIYGIKNATYTFFQKSPQDVSIGEAAILIGMLKGNSIYNPVRNPNSSIKRRNVVINLMRKKGFITKQQAKLSMEQGLELNYRKLDELSGLAQHFREQLRKEIKNIVSKLRKPNGKKYNIYKDGLKIHTTIDPVLQSYAEKAFIEQMKYLQNIYFSYSWNRVSNTLWEKHNNVLIKAMKNSDRWKKLKNEGLSDEKIYEIFKTPVKMTIYDWRTNSEKDTIMSPLDSIKYHKEILQGGLLAIDPLSGKIKAWIGGNNFKFFKFDHVNINTKRQIGSAIKPLLYALALTDLGFNAKTQCPNISQCFPNFNNWCSHNDDNKQTESTTFERGLIHSYNNVSAYLIKLLGPQRFAEFLKQCNITSKIPYFPSISLGTPEISLYEAVWAYSVFPGNGYSVKPFFIEKIEDKSGNIIASFVTQKKEIINANDAYEITNILKKATYYGTSYQLRQKFNIDYDVAGKTGTTNDNSDAWFIGFTPQLLCGIWVGFDEGFISLKSNHGYGSQAAMPIFADFFQSIYSNSTHLGYNKNVTFKPPYIPNSETDSSNASSATFKPQIGDNKTNERLKQRRRSKQRLSEFDK